MTKIKPETESKLADMYRQGNTMIELANKFNINIATIHNHLKKHIPVSERKRRVVEKKSTIDTERLPIKFKELYSKGHSSVKI